MHLLRGNSILEPDRGESPQNRRGTCLQTCVCRAAAQRNVRALPGPGTFPSPHGRARPGPWETQQRRAAGPDSAPAAPINANNFISGAYGLFARRRGLRPQRAHGSSPGGAGGARPGPSTDSNNQMHNTHTALPIYQGNWRDEQPAALRQQEVPLRGSAASG